jgi:hypothetical protein
VYADLPLQLDGSEVFENSLKTKITFIVNETKVKKRRVITKPLC